MRKIKIQSIYFEKTNNSKVTVSGKTRNSICVSEEGIGKGKWYTLEEFRSKFRK